MGILEIPERAQLADLTKTVFDAIQAADAPESIGPVSITFTVDQLAVLAQTIKAVAILSTAYPQD